MVTPEDLKKQASRSEESLCLLHIGLICAPQPRVSQGACVLAASGQNLVFIWGHYTCGYGYHMLPAARTVVEWVKSSGDSDGL